MKSLTAHIAILHQRHLILPLCLAGSLLLALRLAVIQYGTYLL